jgi:hypothetical protein
MRLKFYDLPVRLHSENKITANKVNEKLGEITFLFKNYPWNRQKLGKVLLHTNLSTK